MSIEREKTTNNEYTHQRYRFLRYLIFFYTRLLKSVALLYIFRTAAKTRDRKIVLHFMVGATASNLHSAKNLLFIVIVRAERKKTIN